MSNSFKYVKRLRPKLNSFYCIGPSFVFIWALRVYLYLPIKNQRQCVPCVIDTGSELGRMEQKVPWEGVSDAAKREGLYEEHEIKKELVIGPEVLQPADVAFTLRTSKLRLNNGQYSNSNTDSFVVKPKAMWANRESLQVISQNSVSTDTCKKRLSTKTNQEEIRPRLDNKEDSDRSDESLQCKVDSSQSFQKQYSRRLKRTHIEKKHFTCAICSEECLEIDYLNSHMKNHAGQQSFPCDICKKEFVTYKNLQNHKQLHGGDTPYSCDICAKQFSHKSYLNSHKRIHVINKTHNCDVCGKQFLYKYQLSTHKQIHVIEKPYTCKNCKKQFTTNQYFVKHIWTCKN